MHDVDDDPLILRIRRADPARSVDAGEGSLRLLLGDSIAAAGRPRRRAPWVAGALLAVLALGAATPAIADGVRQFVAQTGWIGTSPNPPGVGVGSAPSTESDDTEWIDALAPDFVDYAVSVLPVEIGLPPAYDLAAFARVVATEQQAALPGGGYTQVTNVQRNYETRARCIWIDDWLTAETAGDDARADAAAAVLETASDWPATVATDGGGIVDSNREVAAAAASGDRSPVKREYDINCPPVPDGILK